MYGAGGRIYGPGGGVYGPGGGVYGPGGGVYGPGGGVYGPGGGVYGPVERSYGPVEKKLYGPVEKQRSKLNCSVTLRTGAAAGDACFSRSMLTEFSMSTAACLLTAEGRTVGGATAGEWAEQQRDWAEQARWSGWSNSGEWAEQPRESGRSEYSRAGGVNQ